MYIIRIACAGVVREMLESGFGSCGFPGGVWPTDTERAGEGGKGPRKGCGDEDGAEVGGTLLGWMAGGGGEVAFPDPRLPGKPRRFYR